MAPPDFPYPSVLPQPPYPAELLFAQRMISGEECVIGDGNRPEKGIEQGKSANIIRAEVIRFFARGGSEEARIGDDAIKLKGAWVPDELYLTFANIGHALAFFYCHFDEKITMEHAICPALYLDGSRLEGGLKADGIRTNGALCLREKFSSNGELRLAGAKIGGDLDCRESAFLNPQKRAFYADGASVEGGLSLQESKFQGIVRMNGVSVGGNLDCRGAEFSNEVHITVAEIKNTLVLQNIKGTAVFNFASTDAERIADDKESREGFKFALDNFTYRRFIPPDDAESQADVESRIKWLENRPDGHSFSPQPFEQAASALFAIGHDNDAREILLKKEDLLTKDDKMPRWDGFWRRAWYVFAGYGYRLQWTAAWMLGVVLMGTGFFNFADHQCRIVPHQPVVMKEVKNQTAKAAEKCTAENRPTKVVERAFPDYPRFGAFVYSLDVFIPYFSLYQESHWYPQPTEADTDYALVFLRVWYWIEIVAGWILTSLLVLTVTGLLQPRQSSGGK